MSRSQCISLIANISARIHGLPAGKTRRWRPSVDGVRDSSSGGISGPGDGSNYSQEGLDDESKYGNTTLSSSGYVVYDSGGLLEVERWESTVTGAEGIDMGSGMCFFADSGTVCLFGSVMVRSTRDENPWLNMV